MQSSRGQAGACRVTYVLALLCAANVTAQAPPHLTMQLDIRLGAGHLASVTCVSRLPERVPHQFILRQGLNIKRLSDGAGRSLEYDVRGIVGEGITYEVTDTSVSGRLCVEYVGAYPVYDVRKSDFSSGDYKGAIAFNGITLRATEQSKWYPILYDSASGMRAYEAVTYDASVSCSDCRYIYVNGASPERGPEAHFESEQPVPLLLFAGEFEVMQLPALTILNGTEHQLSGRSAELLGAMVDSIGVFYESFLGIPYEMDLVFLQHTITEDSPRRQWGFVTFPTIAFSNRGFTALVNDSAGEVTPLLWPYVGHEMAHYYFGTLVKGHGPYFWFVVESLAEYLGLQVVRYFGGESAFDARIAQYAARAAADSTSRGFNEITRSGQIHDRYRYEIGPLLVVAMEDRFGRGTVSQLLAAIVEEPDRLWNYDSIRETLTGLGVSASAWSSFETDCIQPSFARGCLAQYARN